MTEYKYMNLHAWKQLMAAFKLPINEPVYNKLMSAYAEPQRFYHTAEHIEACLRHLETVRDEIPNPHEVELALWFHDAIYEPFSSTNEKDSADWAEAFLRQQDAKEDIVQRIKQLILITEHHADTQTEDETYMLDIDLSILGAPTHIYDVFERNVRREYKDVPISIFREKRKAILSEFLARDRLYLTDHFNASLCAQAKQNLERAIAAL